MALTYQKLEQAKADGQLEAFIAKAVDRFLSSEEYRGFLEFETYYYGESMAATGYKIPISQISSSADGPPDIATAGAGENSIDAVEEVLEGLGG